MTMPYNADMNRNVSPTGMDVKNVHNRGRLFTTNDVANESQFWLDDLVSDLRENHGK
jgi:hypothetical protein